MTDTNKCAGCFKKIRCRYLVRALDKSWHERCLRCDVCDEILFSFGSRMYFKHEGKFCKMDYMRLFVPGGPCSMCKQEIPSTEKVLKFKNNTTYHLKCFACSVCCYRFCVGDIVYIPKPEVVLCQNHQSFFST